MKNTLVTLAVRAGQLSRFALPVTGVALIVAGVLAMSTTAGLIAAGIGCFVIEWRVTSDE